MRNVARLAYETQGAVDKTPILWLHGFMGCSVDWWPMMESLDDFYHVAVDLPGHGQTGTERPGLEYGFRSTAHAIIATLDELYLDKVNVVGYSMGARLALYLGLHFPDRCLHVVSEGGSPGLQYETDRRDRLDNDKRVRDQLQREGMEAFVESWYAQPLFASLHDAPDVLTAMKLRRRKNSVYGLSRAHEGLSVATQPNLWDELPRMTVDTTLIAGGRDQKYIGISEAMAKQSSHMDVCVVDGAGHNVHAENQAAYLDILTKCLARENV